MQNTKTRLAIHMQHALRHSQFAFPIQLTRDDDIFMEFVVKFKIFRKWFSLMFRFFVFFSPSRPFGLFGPFWEKKKLLLINVCDENALPKVNCGSHRFNNVNMDGTNATNFS